MIGSVYVDAENGGDATGDGTSALPFRTITAGLVAAKTDYTIRVAPGVYNADGGEIFPLRLSARVEVAGDPSVSDGGRVPTLVEGVGSYESPSLGVHNVAIVGAEGATLTGIVIHAAGGVGLWCEENCSVMTASEDTMEDSDYGVVVAGDASTSPSLTGNDIHGNGIAGVATFNECTPRLRRNEIVDNDEGVFAANSSLPDLGTVDDPGGNTFTGNHACGVENATPSVIMALDNSWDQDVQLINAATICSGGTPIANTSSGAVLYQYAPATDAPVFPDAKLVNTFLPKQAALVSTDQPRFTWEQTGQGAVMLAVFSEAPEMGNGSITNAASIRWLWHSGLGRGREGDVLFSEGVSVLNGDLLAANAPVPLARGRTYYWVVWAWDAEDLVVSWASALQYFTLTN
jgi:hypothetical protein